MRVWICNGPVFEVERERGGVVLLCKSQYLLQAQFAINIHNSVRVPDLNIYGNGPLVLILSGWYSIYHLPIEHSSTNCLKMINLLKFLSTTWSSYRDYPSTYTDHRSPNQMPQGGHTLKIHYLCPSQSKGGMRQKADGNSQKLLIKIHFKLRVRQLVDESHQIWCIWKNN